MTLLKIGDFGKTNYRGVLVTKSQFSMGWRVSGGEILEHFSADRRKYFREKDWSYRNRKEWLNEGGPEKAGRVQNCWMPIES